MIERERLVELIIAAQHEIDKAYVEWNRNGEHAPNEAQITADYLLDHGVIVPIVREGQSVYIHQFDSRDVKVTVIGVVTNVDADGFTVLLVDGRQYKMKLDYIGKTVFLTREEAEQVSGEKGENND